MTCVPATCSPVLAEQVMESAPTAVSEPTLAPDAPTKAPPVPDPAPADSPGDAPAQAEPAPAEAPAEPTPAPDAPDPAELPPAPAPPADATTATSGFRTWTDITGKYHAQAQLVSVYGDRVRLLKSDGQYRTVPLDRLSKYDCQYVGTIQAIAGTR